MVGIVILGWGSRRDSRGLSVDGGDGGSTPGAQWENVRCGSGGGGNRRESTGRGVLGAERERARVGTTSLRLLLLRRRWLGLVFPKP